MNKMFILCTFHFNRNVTHNSYHIGNNGRILQRKPQEHHYNLRQSLYQYHYSVIHHNDQADRYHCHCHLRSLSCFFCFLGNLCLIHNQFYYLINFGLAETRNYIICYLLCHSSRQKVMDFA